MTHFALFVFQFSIYNVAAWCLRGLLGKQQEETLFNLFGVIRRLVQPSFVKEDISQLMIDTSTAVTLLERDFPLTLQVFEAYNAIQYF